MAVCEKYQISHSHYLGGPAEWTAADRAKAEAYAAWEREACGSCGTHPDWWDPEKGGHRYAFVADAQRCPGCEVKEQLRDQIDNDAKGIHVCLIPNEDLIPERKGKSHG